MKERIRNQIKDLLRASGDDAERAFWEKTKQQLEYAPISTIHSLCGRILRENPVEAVLDPNFSILDEVQSDLLLKEAVQSVLQKAVKADAEWLDRLAYAYGKKSLSGSFVALYKKCELPLAMGQLDLASLLAPYRQNLEREGAMKEELKNVCQELLSFHAGTAKKTGHSLAVEKIRENWLEIVEAINCYGSGGEEHVKAARRVETYLGCLQTRSKDKDIVICLRSLLDELRQLVLTHKALELLPALHQYLTEIHETIGKRKNSLHALTYNDLEQRTWKLLCDNAEVCRKYQSRIHQIMVDEFQDTNDLQRQIVYLLCSGDAEVLQGEKLFVVGDPKQSIYRFRGADVSVFDRVARDVVAAGGELLDLDTNFRSVDGLLEVFNDLFTELMGTADDLIQFKHLQAHRRCSENLPCVELRVIDKEALNPENEGLEKQAEGLAQRIRSMVDSQEVIIREGTKSGPVSYCDIAILFAASTNMSVYEAALQRNHIPYYILGGRGFYQSQEICDMLNLLRVVDNCYNETALTGVLRSPFFMLSDETLVCLKIQDKTIWQGLQNAAVNIELTVEEREAAVRAYRIIGKLRRLCGFVKVADLLKIALDETQYAELALTEFMGLQVYANIYKLIDIAEAFHSEDFAALNDFLQYIETLAGQQAEESAEQIESETGDTVKLMTVHKAKGLQFPVVFLPDMQRRFHEDAAPAICGSSGGIGIKVPDELGNLVETRFYQETAARERKLAFLEMKRLLYVAFTRAQDYLVLYAMMEKNKTPVDKDFLELNSFFKWLGKIYGFEDNETLPDSLPAGLGKIIVSREQPDRIVPSAAGAGVVCSLQQIIEPDPDEISAITAVLAPVREQHPDAVRTYSASSLLLHRRCPRAFFYRYVAGMPEVDVRLADLPAGGGAPAQLVGLAVHRFYETMRPEDDAAEKLLSAVQETVPAEWVAEVVKAAEPLALQHQDSAFFRGITERIWRREWRFNYYMQAADGMLPNRFSFTGSVDCLLSYPDGSLGIVDYKTDQVDFGDLAAKVESYRWQLGLYTLAAGAAYGRPVKDAQIYFVRLDKTAMVSVGEKELAAIQQEMTEVCRYIASHGDEEQYQCNTDWCCYCNFAVFCPGKA